MCLMRGLEHMSSPFETHTIKYPCPHNFLNVASDENTKPAQAELLPVPNTKAYRIKSIEFIDLLGFGIKSFDMCIMPWWARRKMEHAKALNSTNITPMFFTSYKPSDIPNIIDFLDFPRIRPVVFVGSVELPQVNFLPQGLSRFSAAAGLEALKQHVATLSD